MFKVRIRGIDTTIRELAHTNDRTFMAARRGIVLAAEHLLKVVVSKFGKYQSTGGDPNGYGSWRKLKYETIKRKLRKYGVGNKPLIASGSMMNSFSIVKGGKGRLSASVGSSSEVLVHHVYGAPRANVPMRDPIRVTAVEEKDECHQIIYDEIMRELRR